VAIVAWKGAGQDMAGLASDAESFESLLPREPHGVALGLAALLAPPTPTPTLAPTEQQNGAGQNACHRWRYALRWERPSRLAVLKNALGNSVTTYTDYNAPGNLPVTDHTGNDWPDPIVNSVNLGAWNYQSPSGTTISKKWDHDCDNPLPACQGPTATDVEGEQPGIYYSKGTWDFPDPNAQNLASVYNDSLNYPFEPPVYHPGSDTRGSMVWEDPSMSPLSLAPYGNTDPVTGNIIPGQYDGWAWTLNYGYGPAPANDIIYGPDPGPPLPVMDLTPLIGDSIPGQTGQPKAFDVGLLTKGSASITAQTTTTPLVGLQPGPVTYYGTYAAGGVSQPTQPSWTLNNARDVVGNSADLVNWGLETFNGDAQLNPVITTVARVVIVDSGKGDVSAIEDSMRLRMFTSGSHPGLSVSGGTPTVLALRQPAADGPSADTELTKTWAGDPNDSTNYPGDPKKACNRPLGVILCTDGQSNHGNTGIPANKEWDSTVPLKPCTADTAGTDFENYPPGAAEAMYLDGHQAFPGAPVIRARTFVVGISSDISKCELNRTAYRGRTDASAPNGDAGFLLEDPLNPVPVGSTAVTDKDRLPHVSVGPPVDESGSTPPAPNRFGPDQTPPDNRDYAFFGSDAAFLAASFQKMILALAVGDYTTSASVSAAGSTGHENTVILPSTAFPSWYGHLRAFDTTNPNNLVPLWDAGDILNTPTQPWQPTPALRQLYTWDPSNGSLIPLAVGQAPALNALCASCGMTAAVVDFIRGNDGTLTGTKRNWLLGAPINSTPATVNAPLPYFQAANVVNHKPFENTYATRRSLVWVGTDDGMLHAFDLDDGSEVMALLPPNLIGNQVNLYKNYVGGKTDPTHPNASQTETGQSASPDDHIWGVASSLRYTDIWFGTVGGNVINNYKTVGFLTEGPGGDVVAAIDLTHPYPGRPSPAFPIVPADPNYDASKPVEILWTRRSFATTGNPLDYPGLFGSWSVPAVANDTFTTSKMTFGAGINPSSLYNAQKNADVFVVDPTDGKLLSTTAISPVAASNTSGPLVGLQTIADSGFFQTTASGFQPDNLADLSVQADTNGRLNALWGDWTNPTSKVLIDLNAVAGSPQPIYYSPSVNGIGTQGLQVYALGSGSLYETSPTVSGWNVNRDSSVAPPAGSGYDSTLPPFIPSLFVATNPLKITNPSFGTTLSSAQVLQKVIGGETNGISLSTSDPTYSSGHTRLGLHTQLTSSPLLVVNLVTGSHEALFTAYDPDFGCTGYSYIIAQKFTASPLAFATTTVYAAGPGAASGFVVTAKGAFAPKSGIGNASATLYQVNIDRPSLPGTTNFVPLWWKEQK
jgi:hypothetical protein